MVFYAVFMSLILFHGVSLPRLALFSFILSCCVVYMCTGTDNSGIALIFRATCYIDDRCAHSHITLSGTQSLCVISLLVLY